MFHTDPGFHETRCFELSHIPKERINSISIVILLPAGVRARGTSHYARAPTLIIFLSSNLFNLYACQNQESLIDATFLLTPFIFQEYFNFKQLAKSLNSYNS